MSASEASAVRLRRVLGLAVIVLTGATWPLWGGRQELPQIPWLLELAAAPHWIDPALLAAAGVASLVVLFGPGTVGITRTCCAAFAISWAALISLDQQRLQPWAYHCLLLAAFLALARPLVSLGCCRALVISIYLWSGLSKVDPGFIIGHGQMLLDGLLQAVGVSAALWSDDQRHAAAAAMPAAELLSALLLTLPRTRRYGLILSIAIHAALLLALGPAGLHHEPGVLVWNAGFIAQNVILFGRTRPPKAADPVTETWTLSDRAAILLTASAALLPLLSPFDRWDHWPSWSVYSAHPAIVRVYVATNSADRLPASLQPFIESPRAMEPWRLVRFDQWTFSQRHAPPYPQARWKIALAAAVMARANVDDYRIEILKRQSWWDPQREATWLSGAAAVHDRLNRSLWNTRPRLP